MRNQCAITYCRRARDSNLLSTTNTTSLALGRCHTTKKQRPRWACLLTKLKARVVYAHQNSTIGSRKQMVAPVGKTLGLAFEPVSAHNSLILPIAQLGRISALSGTVHACHNNEHSIVSLQCTGKLGLQSANKRVGADRQQIFHCCSSRPAM